MNIGAPVVLNEDIQRDGLVVPRGTPGKIVGMWMEGETAVGDVLFEANQRIQHPYRGTWHGCWWVGMEILTPAETVSDSSRE